MDTVETKPFDAAEYLTSPERVVAYLDAALQENNQDFFLKALGTVARAKGMSSVARVAGLSRPALYRALDEGGRPEFETVVGVMKALGLQFTVQLAKPKPKN